MGVQKIFLIQKIFDEQVYESKNPFNVKGNYLLELLKKNADVSDLKSLKKPSGKDVKLTKLGTKLSFNETICLKL